MAGREEVLPTGRDSGVDRLEAPISVKHPLNLESRLVLSLFAQEDQMGLTHSPRGQWVLGYWDLQVGLEDRGQVTC